MNRISLSRRGRWRAFICTDDDISVLQTSASYKTKAEADAAVERGYRLLCASKDNRVQAFIRKLLGW